ncbi:hypothetical protein PDE_09974 [Penicillium oxalicum 114-2]|uniref:Uncharacterized protein n=1 Tax=Penicillium oxalicum (strain 114-2 / CGMCC 5302) TaxID=933388 RepID=S7ZX26_PENO1|nr:hypothetical protein PDE_09974 [Penicillium oxalicum 114-2]
MSRVARMDVHYIPDLEASRIETRRLMGHVGIGEDDRQTKQSCIHMIGKSLDPERCAQGLTGMEPLGSHGSSQIARNAYGKEVLTLNVDIVMIIDFD